MQHKTLLTLAVLLACVSLTCLCPSGVTTSDDSNRAEPEPYQEEPYVLPDEGESLPEEELFPDDYGGDDSSGAGDFQLETALSLMEMYDFGQLEPFPNQVGQALVHYLPAEMVLENVLLSPALFYAEGAPDQFTARMIFSFQLMDDQPVQFTYRLVIPKAFAENIDEVDISPPLTRLINPDIEGEVDIQMDANTKKQDVVVTAKKTLSMDEIKQIKDPATAYEAGLRTCESQTGNERLYCYLRLMEQVRGKAVTTDLMLANCNRFTANANQRVICEAMARSKPSLCDQIKDDEFDRQFCQYTVIGEVCRKLSDPADRNACVLETALKTKNRFLCGLATSPDQQNYCAALVKKDKSACGLINDPELRQKCNQAFEQEPGEDVVFEDLCGWFPEDQQAALCQRFLNDLPPGMGLANAGSECGLSCEFRGENYQNVVINIDVFESDQGASQRYAESHTPEQIQTMRETFAMECNSDCSSDTQVEKNRLTVIYDFMVTDNRPNQFSQIRRWSVYRNAHFYFYDHYDPLRNLGMIDRLEQTAYQIFDEVRSQKIK